MALADGPLSPTAIDHFIRYGHVVLEDCFPTGPGTLAQDWLDRAWARLGCDPGDPGTWTVDKIHMDIEQSLPVGEISPKALAAMHQLCGGPERLIETPQWPDAFILNLTWRSEETGVVPGPEAGGWHKDGDFFIHFLDSPEQALLVIVLWDDVLPRGGATYIAADSVPHVARWLAEHPEGACPLRRAEAAEQGVDERVGRMPIKEWIHQCRDFREVTGRAGTVVLMHPYMLHCSSPNVLRRPRFITNPCLAFREPMCLDRPDGAYSPVEQTVLAALGADRFPFAPTTERRRVLPERLKLWEQRRLERDGQRSA